MNCTFCGHEIEKGDHYCQYCGHIVSDDSLLVQESQISFEENEEASLNNDGNIPNSKKETKIKKIIITLLIMLCATGCIVFIILSLPSTRYNQAIRLLKLREYEKAGTIFAKLGNYRDSQIRKYVCIDAKKSISCSRYHAVCIKTDGTVDTRSIRRKDYDLIKQLCDTSDWSNIIAVSTGLYYTVGLKEDGTVVATGWNEIGQCNVSDWSNIVAIETGEAHTVGLRQDGTVVATGWNEYGQCDVSDWSDIVCISAGKWNTVGLTKNGTVLVTGYHRGSDEISSWSEIVSVATGMEDNIYGLKKDGTVVSVGSNRHHECDTSQWTDIVSLAAGKLLGTGLKSDGSVIVAGENFINSEYLTGWKEWKDIVEIDASDWYILGLTANGTVVIVGEDRSPEGPTGWRWIRVPLY